MIYGIEKMIYDKKRAKLISEITEMIIDHFPQNTTDSDYFDLSEHLTLVIDEVLTSVDKFFAQRKVDVIERIEH